MPGEKLRDRLKSAYTEVNLNRISTRVIEAYRKKNFAYINALHRKIYADQYQEELKINKIFAGLILMYHPDRLVNYHREIEAAEEDRQLEKYTHIFITLENLDLEVREEPRPEPDFTYAPQEEYGLEETDYDFIIDEDENFEHDLYEEPSFMESHDFITTLSINEYGHNRFEIPRHDLENLTGLLDMSGQGIDDLNGIDACVNLTGLDLSDNDLSDITDLGYLTMLEELYLSGNTIMSVDGLMLLDKLKKLDLSFNSLDDVSPLIGLPALAFLNIIGNAVPPEQISKLRKQGVVVIS
jgi:hypothetical protein